MHAYTFRRSIYETIRLEHPHFPIRRYKRLPQEPAPWPSYNLCTTSSQKRFSSTPDTIIGWFWRFFNTWLCSFQFLRREFVINSCRCPFQILISWLWHIFASWCYLFRHLQHYFVIDSWRCPIRRLLGWLSRRVSSPPFIPQDTPIHFDAPVRIPVSSPYV